LKPYYETKLGKLYHGDCLDILPQLEPVDLVLTDPPYGMNNNVDSSRFSGGTAGHIAQRGNGGRFKENIIGDDKPFNPEHLLNFKKVILWGANHFSKKLSVGTTLVWIKKQDSGFGAFLSDAEIGWMNTGHGVYCFKDLSLLSTTRDRLHPNQKPIPLLMWCIEKAKIDGVICDPYSGSGSTLVACERLNRKWIGCEISEKYCEIIAKRLEQETSQLKLFAG